MTSPPKDLSWDPSVLEKSETGKPKNPGRRRSSVYGTYSRVVAVAVDNSHHSRRAFEWYVLHLWRPEDLVVLVHCPEAPRLPTFSWKSGISLPIEDWKRIIDDVNLQSRQLEEDYEAVCTLHKMKHKMRAEAHKHVGEGLLKMVDDEGADVLVCGSKGCRDGKNVKRGTVAEYLSRNSAVPVVVVPNKLGGL